MAENKLNVFAEQKDSNLNREETRARERYRSPAVDIYETEDGLVLLADLPGVEKDGLEIELDRGLLTIAGRQGRAPQEDEGRREYVLQNFYRQFRLPDTLDAAATSAVLKNGVLTLKLPRAAAARPRRIEVATAH